MALKSPPKVLDRPELSAYLTDIWRYLSSLPSKTVPSSSTDKGTPGQLAYDDTYFYVCYDRDSWARIAFTDTVF